MQAEKHDAPSVHTNPGANAPGGVPARSKGGGAPPLAFVLLRAQAPTGPAAQFQAPKRRRRCW